MNWLWSLAALALVIYLEPRLEAWWASRNKQNHPLAKDTQNKWREK